MKHLILTIVGLGILIALTSGTAEADWYFSAWYNDCDCSWGSPSPWDPWWECSCYWDIWAWCATHPYWTWPWWCRRYIEIHYSPCGHYYYVYYDYYVPGCSRVLVDGRYRYRYSVNLGHRYSVTERIPRQRGLESSSSGSRERPGYDQPMPDEVYRTLERLGPDYRMKTVARHTEEPSQQQVQRTSTVTVRGLEDFVDENAYESRRTSYQSVDTQGETAQTQDLDTYSRRNSGYETSSELSNRSRETSETTSYETRTISSSNRSRESGYESSYRTQRQSSSYRSSGSGRSESSSETNSSRRRR